MGKRLWDLAKSRFEIGTFLLAHRHKVWARGRAARGEWLGSRARGSLYT